MRGNDCSTGSDFPLSRGRHPKCGTLPGGPDINMKIDDFVYILLDLRNSPRVVPGWARL